ncbi:Ferrous-iron efflux pump FieF [Vibrio ruber DSM 16370]|uniref:Cation-efflux pump FieF n=1 Tax=Vibrio ruber (strain DSM 16370 / JCM 11486 / BCRC 17186 / CECT 7878 / LMG 23124 / VR1) TaxID=1123498 RepID=A0A1R4LLR9_VIBR1|nr:CDF family cation-efflux transporter FieF [Vibrio ruber]SJN57408.1 Ferrous-iron efflux pump FieF [Vibrio ruber DSM 16370]
MHTNYIRLVKSAAWSATVVAITLLLIKMFAWWQTGSVSLLASVIDSLLDIAASVVNLWVVRYALQPADREHTFGHGKAESLAALAQAMFISGSACFLLLNGVDRFFRPQPLQTPELGIYVSALAIVVTFLLVRYQKYVVRKTGSQAIAADSLHYQSDLWMNIAIMIALALSWQGVTQADAIFAVGIGVYILYSAYQIIHEAIQTLLDRKLPDEEISHIRQLSLSVDGVLGIHGLRTRMSGPVRFIQLHLELDDHLPLIQAHEISDQVEALLLEQFPGSDVLVHQDPYSVILQSEYEQKVAEWS